MRDRPGQGRDVLSVRNVGLLLGQGTILAAAAVLAMVAGSFVLGLDQVAVRTMVFSTLVFSQLLHALSVRAGAGPLRRPGRLMTGSLVGAFALQLVMVYTPLGQQILRTVALDASAMAVTIGASALSMFLVRRLNSLFGRNGD